MRWRTRLFFPARLRSLQTRATMCAKRTIIRLVDLSARCRAAIPACAPFPFPFLRDTRIRTIGDNDGKTAAGRRYTTTMVREGREELLGINAGKRRARFALAAAATPSDSVSLFTTRVISAQLPRIFRSSFIPRKYAAYAIYIYNVSYFHNVLFFDIDFFNLSEIDRWNRLIQLKIIFHFSNLSLRCFVLFLITFFIRYIGE